jgi:hypothetical protein
VTGAGYGFDPVGNLVSVGSGAYTVYYGYDAMNRLSAVSYQFESTLAANYNYDAVGNLQTLTYPNGVAHTYSYDSQEPADEPGRDQRRRYSHHDCQQRVHRGCRRTSHQRGGAERAHRKLRL